jgi:hypothetical protein
LVSEFNNAGVLTDTPFADPPINNVPTCVSDIPQMISFISNLFPGQLWFFFDVFYAFVARAKQQT